MNFYLDIDKGRLINGVNDPQEVTDLVMVLRDIVSATVTIVKVNTAAGDLYVPVDLAAGRFLIFGAKPVAGLDGVYFVTQSAWTKSEGVTGVYTANIELTEAALIAAVGAAQSVALLAEFTQVDDVGNNYDSVQFNLSVIPDVNRGGEPVATRVSPSGGVYALMVDDNGQFYGRKIE